MKKFLLLMALLLGIVLRPFEVSGIVSILLTEGSILGIWLLAGSLPLSQKLPLFPEISAIFFSINPWYVSVSRSTHNNVAIFLAIILFLLSVKVFKEYSVIFSSIFLILIIIFLVSTPKNLLHGYINSKTPVWLSDEQRREHGDRYRFPLVIAAHNRLVNYSLNFLDIYSQHFQGDFLFISGDVRNNSGGEMYFFDFFFIVLALVLITKKPQGWKIIFIWLFLAPIPSALEFSPPDASKAYLMIIPLVILSSYGSSYFISKFNHHQNLVK